MASESEKKRAERRRQRELKDARKEELSGAMSSAERRQIKAKYSEPKENSNEGKSGGNSYDSMSQREEAAGLNNTTVGRDSFYDSDIELSAPESSSNQVLYPDASGGSASGGGGNFSTFVLDVVKSDNTAGTAIFNGSGVI